MAFPVTYLGKHLIIKLGLPLKEYCGANNPNLYYVGDLLGTTAGHETAQFIILTSRPYIYISQLRGI
jgi:hypothetical protein